MKHLFSYMLGIVLVLVDSELNVIPFFDMSEFNEGDRHEKRSHTYSEGYVLSISLDEF